MKRQCVFALVSVLLVSLLYAIEAPVKPADTKDSAPTKDDAAEPAEPAKAEPKPAEAPGKKNGPAAKNALVFSLVGSDHQAFSTTEGVATGLSVTQTTTAGQPAGLPDITISVADLRPGLRHAGPGLQPGGRARPRHGRRLLL